MIDNFFAKSRTKKDVFTDDYYPEKAITDRKLVNSHGSNLCVLFPPWHGGGRPYERLIRRLAQKGNAVLAYYFHNEILRPDAEQVRASFVCMRNKISVELEEVTKTHSYNAVHLIGLSLGNPALSMVTSRFTGFDKATMVLQQVL